MDDYKPRTLKRVAARGSDAKSSHDKEDTIITHADIFPSRVSVTYAGSARPLPQIKKDVLAQWARLYAGYPEFYTEPYETEMLFTENGAKYWLAIRNESLAQFQELKKREPVDLYLIRVGKARTGGKWEWMLLVESFRRSK